MPSKGINFSSTKSKTKSSALSTNPRTTATRKWEHELGGLSLALHRVNKAATVARGRAIAKVKSTSTYAEAGKDVREKLVQEAIDEVNQKRDLKRAEAQQQWIELYGEKDRWDKDNEMMQVDEEEEDDDEDGGDEDSSISKSIESDGLEEEPSDDEEEESDDEEEDEEDYSAAEEVDSEADEDEDDVELSQEQQEALTNKLLELRERQSHEQQKFIKRLEAQASLRGRPETPDEYVFASGK